MLLKTIKLSLFVYKIKTVLRLKKNQKFRVSQSCKFASQNFQNEIFNYFYVCMLNIHIRVGLLWLTCWIIVCEFVLQSLFAQVVGTVEYTDCPSAEEWDTTLVTSVQDIIFTNPSARAGYDTRSIFKQSLTGLNSEFSFSQTSCLTKADQQIYTSECPGYDRKQSHGEVPVLLELWVMRSTTSLPSHTDTMKEIKV